MVVMTRPTYAENITSYFDGDTKKQQVEFTFGISGETDSEGHGVYFRDTLREQWADRTPEERLAEAERRYDQWVAAVNVATDPAVPTLQSLRDDVAAQEEALRSQQRALLDARGRLAEGEANQPVAVAVRDGAWSEPSVWDIGVVPDVDTRAVIPLGVAVTVDAGVSVVASVAPVEEPAPDEG